MSDGQQMSTRNISPLSFAALEDTGWYLANYSDIEPSPLGRGASCDFLFQDCLGEGGSIPSYSDQLFCNYDKFAGCAPNHMAIALCNLRNLTSRMNQTVPAEYDYFDNTVSSGLLYLPFGL
jgi:Leishmanolysin